MELSRRAMLAPASEVLGRDHEIENEWVCCITLGPPVLYLMDTSCRLLQIKYAISISNAEARRRVRRVVDCYGLRIRSEPLAKIQ